MTEKTNERPLAFYGTDTITPIFAELAAVNFTEHVCSLTFFHVVRPVTDDSNEVDAIESIPARCIAEIVIPIDQVPAILEAIIKSRDNPPWGHLQS